MKRNKTKSKSHDDHFKSYDVFDLKIKRHRTDTNTVETENNRSHQIQWDNIYIWILKLKQNLSTFINNNNKNR